MVFKLRALVLNASFVAVINILHHSVFKQWRICCLLQTDKELNFDVETAIKV